MLRVQSQQLPTESQVLEHEVLPGMESADQPAEEMSERHNHGKNCSGKIRIQSFTKSFILQVYDVLARHKEDISRLRCRSFRMITWSSKSRRQLPTQRSATPFCHGLRKRASWDRDAKFGAEVVSAVRDMGSEE